jgi:hypothetical protein
LVTWGAEVVDFAALSDGAKGVDIACWVADANRVFVGTEVVTGAERLDNAISGDDPRGALLLLASFGFSFGGAELLERKVLAIS